MRQFAKFYAQPTFTRSFHRTSMEVRLITMLTAIACNAPTRHIKIGSHMGPDYGPHMFVSSGCNDLHLSIERIENAGLNI